MSYRQCALPFQAVTKGPLHHWFGYYDKCPWDCTGRYLLALEAPFADRPPRAGDAATILLIDLANGNSAKPIAQTTAWNWQMGSIFQWLPTAPDRLVFYNARAKDHYIAVIQDVFTGETRTLPRAIYGLSRDASFAMTLDFERLAERRPGYGYSGFPDPRGADPCPADEGIYRLDVQTGESRRVISFRQIIEIQPTPTFQEGKHWFNHLLVNPDNSRFAFVHRWTKPTRRWFTRFFTARPDGSDIRLVNPDPMTSHFDYRSPHELLAWAHRHDQGDHYYIFNDQTGACKIVGEELFNDDGDCSFSPDKRWVLTDSSYPDRGNMRALILYHIERNERIDVGRFSCPPVPVSELRTDLHPRWRRDGRRVCFDSTNDGTRQVYVMDVSSVVA